jgi:hypothetical protein
MPFGMELRWRRGTPSGGGGGGVAATGTLAGAGTASLTALTIATEQAETTALVARMAIAPTAARRALIDGLIGGLKADGIWGRLDWLLVTAAHDAQAARLNWRAARMAAAVNAPAFAVDRGYAGDGASAYLDLGEGITAGGLYSRDSATLGVWVNVGNATSSYQVGVAEGLSGNYALYLRSSVSAVGARLNGGTASYAAAGQGHLSATRGSAAAFRTFVAGVPIGETLATSAAPGGTACVLRAGPGYSAHRIAAAHLGGALTDGEVAAMHARLNTYLSAIGAQ